MSNFTMDDVKAALGDIAAKNSKFMDAQKARLGEVSEKQLEHQARLLDIEQKAARRGGDFSGGVPHDDHTHALRALLEGHADLRAMADRKQRRTVMDLPPGYFKAAIVSGTGLAVSEHRQGIVAAARRRLTIRSLIPSVPTDAGSVTYTRETGSTNNAATVSETTLKPESSVTFEMKTALIVTIAHWIKLSLQVLSDTPQLQQFIDTLLRYGVALIEENQILKGSGVGNNLEGLYTLATAYSAPIVVPGATRIDTIRLMMAQLELANFTTTGIVLHPADWAAIQLTKDKNGRYIFGDPGSGNLPMMWKVPVIPTPAMTQDTALVGDFAQAAVIFDREQDRVDLSTEDADNFQKNMVTARGEERIGLGILRPAALIKNADLPAT